MKPQKILSVLLAFVLLSIITGSPSRAQPAHIQTEQYADLAIGVPFRDVAPTVDAGGVSLIFGTPGGLQAAGSEWFDQWFAGGDGPNTDDQFGATMAQGDFDGNGYVDLAVGVPQEEVAGQPDAGGVNIFYQQPTGFSSAGGQFWTEADFGPDQVDQDEYFGKSLAVGDFNYDGFDDLAIGVPAQDFGFTNIGMVRVMFGSFSGLSPEGSIALFQGLFGLADEPEQNDSFGEVLAAGDFDGNGYHDLVIGVPDEDVGEMNSAGAVHVVPGGPHGFNTNEDDFFVQGGSLQDEPEDFDSFGSALACGDFDGNGYDDLAIGVPMESLDGIYGQGAVSILWGGPMGLDPEIDMLWWQELLVAGESGSDDHFGASLAVGDFNGDGLEDLAIGAPDDPAGEPPDIIQWAGSIFVMYGNFTDIPADQIVHEPPLFNEQYGRIIASGDFSGDGYWDLAVGLASTDIEAPEFVQNVGSVNVLYGNVGGLTTALDQTWFLNDANGMVPEGDDQFGTALVALTGPVTSGSRIFLPTIVRTQ